MTTEDAAYQKVRQTLETWELARQEADRVRRQYMTSESLDTSGQRQIRMPPKIWNEEGMKEVQSADAMETEAWEAHQQAIRDWRG